MAQSPFTHSTLLSPAQRINKIHPLASNPRFQGRQHIRYVLDWLWTWRIVDRHIVASLLGISRSGSYRLMDRLHRMGYIQALQVEGTPVHPWLLTKAGAQAISPYLDEQSVNSELAPITSPTHIRLSLVVHDLLTQVFVLRLIQNPPEQIRSLLTAALQDKTLTTDDDTDDIESPTIELLCASWFETTQNRIGGAKIPDAVIRYIISRGDVREVSLAVEVQQSRENAAVRARNASLYCQALAKHEIDAMIWCSTRPTIPPLHAAETRPGLREWFRNSARHWMELDTSPYESWMPERISQLSDHSLESKYYYTLIED